MTTIMKSEKDFGGYWIKGLKNFKGHEGEPLFQCTITKNGKKVGFFSEDSWGGNAQLDMISKVEEKALTEYAKSVDAEPWEESYHSFIAKIADELDQQKWYKRNCKKKTLFRIKGMKEGEWKTVNHPFEPRVKDFIVKKYGKKVDFILNEAMA